MAGIVPTIDGFDASVLVFHPRLEDGRIGETDGSPALRKFPRQQDLHCLC
jgi:hypothetical protein